MQDDNWRDLPSNTKSIVCGKWVFFGYIGKHDAFYPAWRCNKCNGTFFEKYNYCPHCGSDMRGEGNG